MCLSLHLERNPPINLVIQSGAIPRLVQFLRGHPYTTADPSTVQHVFFGEVFTLS
jgi:hypothetical protein